MPSKIFSVSEKKPDDQYESYFISRSGGSEPTGHLASGRKVRISPFMVFNAARSFPTKPLKV
jgi:hypothetical protein